MKHLDGALPIALVITVIISCRYRQFADGVHIVLALEAVHPTEPVKRVEGIGLVAIV